MSKKKNQQNMCNYWNLKSIVEENTGEKDPVEVVQDAWGKTSINHVLYYGELLELKSKVEENAGEKDPVEAVQDAAMSREEVARIWVKGLGCRVWG